jgi:hypothetical protein
MPERMWVCLLGVSTPFYARKIVSFTFRCIEFFLCWKDCEFDFQVHISVLCWKNCDYNSQFCHFLLLLKIVSPLHHFHLVSLLQGLWIRCAAVAQLQATCVGRKRAASNDVTWYGPVAYLFNAGSLPSTELSAPVTTVWVTPWTNNEIRRQLTLDPVRPV